MPDGWNVNFWTKAHEIKWRSCVKKATEQMIDEGWQTYANKFNRVRKKRAEKLWRAA